MLLLMNLKLNALYWYLISHFIPESSMYVGIMPCICKKQLSDLVILYLNVIPQCLRKCMEDSGLADISLKAGIEAQVSVPGVMKCRHYNWSVSIIKIMADALRRKLLSTFMNTQSTDEKDKFIILSKSLYYAFLETQFQHLCTSSDLKKFESKLS